jgi:hypothetical protein
MIPIQYISRHVSACNSVVVVLERENHGQTFVHERVPYSMLFASAHKLSSLLRLSTSLASPAVSHILLPHLRNARFLTSPSNSSVHLFAE